MGKQAALAVRRLAVLVLGLTLLSAGGLPMRTWAEDSEVVECTGGTTRVTVEATTSNLSFEVPTVIPFVALADGTLVGPSASSTLITNLSVYGIHVVGASVDFDEDWLGTSDAAASEEENAIEFQFGPEGALTDAFDDGDDDVSAIEAYNLACAGAAGSSIGIETTGRISAATVNLIAGVPDSVATITWTLAAGSA